MSNELFTSMKNQMMPSDDCVNDLLAKIAALDAGQSSEQPADNVLAFEPAARSKNDENTDNEFTVVQKNPNRKTNKKKVWGFSTAAIASAIALVSVFTMIGDDPSDMQTSLNGLLDNQDVAVETDNGQDNPVVTDENGNPVVMQEGENAENKTGQNRTAQNESGEEVSSENQDGTIQENATQDVTKQDALAENKDNKNSSDKDKTNGAAANSNTNNNNKNNAKDNKGNTTGNEEAAENTSGAGQSAQGTVQTPVSVPVAPVQSTNEPVVSDPAENKIVPSEATKNELTWTKEILSDSAVKQITVQGSNYVVNTSSTDVVTGSAIKTLSLNVPETETTAADTVEASALKVANVSTDLAVAVDVNEYQGTLVYLNSSYDPETLGQFVKDAGIASGTNFSSVVYTGERIGYSSGKRINKQIKSIVVDTIFSVDAPKGKSSGYNSGTEKVVFVSNHNPTGTKITFGVSNSGYFRVVMSNGNVYTFNIGEAAANDFIDQLLSE